MPEQQRAARTPTKCLINITYPDSHVIEVYTRDISDTGVFIVVDESTAPAVGTVVTGQVQGLMTDAPVLDMEVVRVSPEGVGLRFVEG